MFLSGKYTTFISTLVLSLCLQSTACAATVKWKEDANGINLNTVCYNHRYGSIRYRQCRADAQKQFKGRCAHFSRQLDYATGTQRAEYKKGEHKYCYAARHLSIVN